MSDTGREELCVKNECRRRCVCETRGVWGCVQLCESGGLGGKVGVLGGERVWRESGQYMAAGQCPGTGRKEEEEGMEE